MNRYNDTLTWYTDRYPDDTLIFFSRVIGASQGTTFNCLDAPDSSPEWVPLRNQQSSWIEIEAFSVEQLGHDRIVLSFDLPSSSYTPIAFALISRVNNEYVLVGKIVLGSESPVPRSVKRVFNLQLPYTGDNAHFFPRYTIESVRMNSSPFGGEYVMADEHHHSVVYRKSGESEVVDSYPVGLGSSRNFMESAKLFMSDVSGTSSQPSYVYGELGTLQSEYSDMTGQRSTGSDFLGGKRDRKISTADIILNLLEVLIMANNKIQILGKAIEQISPPTGSGEDRFILISDSVEAGDNRNLQAISFNQLLKSITYKYTGTSSTLGASVNVVEVNSNGTLTFGVTPSVAIVFNTKTSTNKSSREANTVTINGVDIPPKDCAIFYYDGSSVIGHTITEGVNDAISQIISGDYASFSKINISGTLGVSGVSTFNGKLVTKAGAEVDNLTVSGTATTKDLKVTNQASLNNLSVTGTLSVVNLEASGYVRANAGFRIGSYVSLTYSDEDFQIDVSPSGFYSEG